MWGCGSAEFAVPSMTGSGVAQAQYYCVQYSGAATPRPPVPGYISTRTLTRPVPHSTEYTPARHTKTGSLPSGVSARC